ncbi:MAG: DUF4358 domain-containing protein [Clostridiales bacterium]|nr:DUF4358 domain-containing protein [Clostridiales bacterium]
MKKRWLAVIMAACMLTGCGGNGKDTEEAGKSFRNDVSTKTLAEAVAAELGEDYWADAELAPEYLSDWYGVSDDMYEEYYGQTPMISVNVDSLIIVKAKEDTIEDVENAFDTYREAMIQDSLQYPVNIPKIQASQIETYGNYVCFVQLGDDMNEAEGEEAVKECQAMNEKALAVIEKELTE